MMLTKIGYQETGKELQELPSHTDNRRQQSCKANDVDDNRGDDRVAKEPSFNLTEQAGLLHQQMKIMMELVTQQFLEQPPTRGDANSRGKQRQEGRQGETRYGREKEDDAESLDTAYDSKEEHHRQWKPQNLPFKIEAKLDITSFGGAVNAEEAKSWLDKLKTYIGIYQYTT